MAADDLPDARSDAKFDRERARKAARDPRRPGEKCKAEPARYKPVVNHGRCEAKSDCVAVCPFDVFVVRRFDDADWKPLSPFAKLMVWAHRKQTAYAVRRRVQGVRALRGRLPGEGDPTRQGDLIGCRLPNDDPQDHQTSRHLQHRSRHARAPTAHEASTRAYGSHASQASPPQVRPVAIEP